MIETTGRPRLRARLTAATRRGAALAGGATLFASLLLAGTAGQAAAAPKTDTVRSAAAQAGPAQADTAVAAVGGWTCSGAAIPAGYVLTDYDPWGCGGFGSWFQAPAHNKIWTCSGSPVVSGYVITSYNKTGCRGIGAWYHELVHDKIWTCGGSPIPPGYRSVQFISGGCNGVGAWLLRTI
ncbi:MULTISPECIES: hypothetical protein [unclassified Streptomyces]|uniref:hypothetical protein n=1 Tax=unclassified Streptomyces TaxID=2593676 RepID=UPI002250F95F|nr:MULTISPECIES: hypothetical protein [unclassified Streptomyces]MCX4524757.1 hypothetical protein [Streptomyces sp. NBC_01551]MCX4544733.1 hypothetical protein [Streptomyces sp. NBC_01565]